MPVVASAAAKLAVGATRAPITTPEDTMRRPWRLERKLRIFHPLSVHRRWTHLGSRHAAEDRNPGRHHQRGDEHGEADADTGDEARGVESKAHCAHQRDT